MTRIIVVGGVEGGTNQTVSTTPEIQFQVTAHRLQLGYLQL